MNLIKKKNYELYIIFEYLRKRKKNFYNKIINKILKIEKNLKKIQYKLVKITLKNFTFKHSVFTNFSNTFIKFLTRKSNTS